jgi:hypothetical protein
MDKTLGKEYALPAQRIAFLGDNCDKVEEIGYMKRFSPEDILEMKEQLSETDIQINDLEIEKAELTKGIKEQIKPLAETRKTLLQNIKQKSEFTKEKCFKFIDQAKKEVGYYNEEGDLVDLRPASADELQSTIFQAARLTGTND